MTATAEPRPYWQFRPGESGNPDGAASKARRLAELIRKIEADYEPTESQRPLLKTIARFLDDGERSRQVWVRARASNTAARLLRQFKKRKKSSSIEELFGS
jgi:hypothetical protein